MGSEVLGSTQESLLPYHQRTTNSATVISENPKGLSFLPNGSFVLLFCSMLIKTFLIWLCTPPVIMMSIHPLWQSIERPGIRSGVIVMHWMVDLSRNAKIEILRLQGNGGSEEVSDS